MGIRQVSAVLLTLMFLSTALFAQSASTSTLTGDVADPAGAVVADAIVQLTDLATNATQITHTNASGHYSFPSLQPGNYHIVVRKDKFRQTTIDLTVTVGVNVAQNFRLEIGAPNEIVEVHATGQELQVTDASVGNVVNANSMENLPSLSRDAAALLQLQPMSAPSYNSEVRGSGEGDTTSGGVAGALADQNTFSLDGGDATSNTEGDAGYANGFEGTNRAAVPTPVESIEEFRVTTNNSNLFSRSSGAEVQMVTRKGTNGWHGAAYEYNQNTDYNANSYQLKQAGQDRPVWQDNRYGFRIGGPILKDKAFFFLMYEGRKFKKGTTFTRLVPSDLFKQGVIQFPDANGNLVKYNFNPANGPLSTGCTVSATNPTGACDPRGIGLSPTISQIWNQFEPTGNNTSEGDTLNTIGFDSTVPVTQREHDGIARFDYNLSSKWSLNAVARYDVADVLQSSQIHIGGITGGTKGVPKSTDSEPVQPRYYVVGLTGRLSNNVTNDFHVDFLRYYWQWARRAPFPQASGLGAALQIYQESNTNGLVPMNVDTQNARSRVWDGKDYSLNDEVSWLHGQHLVQFGGTFRHQNFYHVRDDKVVGGLAAPLYFAEYTSSDMTFPSDNMPASLATGQSTNWKKAYAALMGMIDHTAQLLTRGPDLTANTPGTPNFQRSLVDYYDLHVVDTWRLKPTLTLAYGLDWGIQTPPYETKGLQTIMVYGTDPHATVTYQNYMAQAQAAALQGQAFAPELGFAPIRTTGRKYPSDMDWHNFAPRFSIAWNPRSSTGLLNHLFGDGKSVIRTGYGRYFDRLNGVGLVMTPALGIGFGNGVSCKGVDTTGACLGKNGPSNAYRIGVDGNNPPIPSLGAITAPVVPGFTADANSPYQSYDFRIDPKRKVGVEDTWTLGFQRQLAGNMMIEAGYVGRVAHHLYTNNDINQIPYMLTSGGQTFGQAYDAIQRQFLANPSLRTACAAGVAGCTVSPQAFFETQPDVVANYGGTAAFVSAMESGGAFSNADVTTIYDSIGLNGFAALPMDSQFLGTQISTSMGDSIYNAGYVSLRKQLGHGLILQGNYTYSHSSDDAGLAQSNVFISPSDGFNRRRDYQTSYFDRRHVITGFFIYDLPFGQGHSFGGNGFLNKIIGGWKLSSAITTSSGVPQRFLNCNYGDELGDGYLDQCSSWVATGSAAFGTNSPHRLADGSLNSFANPDAVYASFRMPLFGDKLAGGQTFRGMHRFNMDSALTKSTKITERVSFDLSLQAINVFNHVDFTDPGMDLGSPPPSQGGSFGAITTQYNLPRFLNIGAKVSF